MLGGPCCCSPQPAADAVHLTGELDPPQDGRRAVPDHYFEPHWTGRIPALRRYDRAALLGRRWVETTLCGRSWVAMIGSEGVSVSPYGRVALAPSCRRCLSLMDQLFPQPDADPRQALVAELAADLVSERGYCEVRQVPGDQQTALRARIRKLVRDRTGCGCQTFCRGSTIFVVCEPISDQHWDENMHVAVEAVERVLSGDPAPPLPSEWVIFWETWSRG